MPRRRLIHAGEKFRVERFTEKLPDGTRHARDVIVHPGAAVILALLSDGRIVMVRNTRAAVGAELLELPAGTLDDGETPEGCAARELAEETGYTAARLRPLLRFYAAPGYCTERLHTFVATGLKRGRRRLQTGERIRVEPRTLKACLASIASGEICDAKTIAALMYYARFARRTGGAA